MQPEEVEGVGCPECGERVNVHTTNRGKWPTEATTCLVAACFTPQTLMLMGLGKPVLWPLVAVFLLIVAGSIPIFVLARRHDGRRILKSLILECTRCGYVRIGGAADDEQARDHFREGRAAITSLHRKYSAVFAFFLLVYLGYRVLGDHPPQAVTVTLAIAFVGWTTARNYLRIWRPDRRWWAIGPFGR